ncbi:MAG TPA: condensation domain-containing protein, partial [Blastocatellia bacterium]|nr:condensation domain-containing protein [Blastocatellia bacterium]
GSSTVLVEVEGHGRDEIFEDLDLTRTLGWFTTSHPLRIEIAGGSGVEWLRSLKEQVREAGRRGIYFGMLRYLSGEPHLRESLRARSRAEVSFNYLGQLDLVLKEGALFRAAKERPGEMRSGREQRRHLIEINGSVLNGRLHLGWTYSEHVHRQETVEKAANRTLEVLRELIAGSRSVGPRPYTPSDFPLAALNQQRLNQLLAADPDLEDIYPLSPLQKAMLFHALSGMKSEALFEQLSCRLRGRVDLAAFRRAWQGLADRHPILRTSFDWSESDEPVQVVHRQVKLPIADLDWRAVTREEQDLRYRALVQADREQGFDLTKPPLMRLTLVRIDDEHYRLIWSHHHLVLDGWSTPLILQEVFASYEAFRQGREPEMKDGAPYREYIGWLKRQDPQRAEAYWRERLKGFTRPTQLWIDRDSGSRVGREERSEVRQTKMSSEATARLQGIAKRHRLTINTILQGAWGLFLSKYLGEDDLVFGTTVSGRPVDLPGSESIIGPFINTLPVRMRIPFESSLRSWLLELQREQTEYGQYMYSSMVEQYSEIPLGMALYESILIYENYPAASPDRNRERLLEVSEVQAPVRTKYPLTIVSGPGSELALSIVYDLRRYDGREISRFLTHFQNLIERISDNPEQPIWSLSLLSETEQSQLLAQWSGTRSAEADNPYLHRRFEGRAEKSSDSVAVILGEEHVTYGHLNARADRLATQLLELGAGPEVRVGISPGLSSRLPEVLLGILKAGATCLAPEPPSEEGDENRQLSPPEPEAFLMVTPHTPVAGEPGAETRIVRFESSRELVEGRNETASANPVAEGNLALIACTSGTTGRPRRVMLTHRGLSNQVLGLAEAVGLSEEDRVLWRGVLSTNLSIWELFAPLLAGGCLIAVPPAASQNPGLLLRLMAEEQITTACLTPATHALLLREGAGHDGRMAGRVVLSGEMFYRPAGQAFCGRSSASLFNVYSVGEGSGAVTVEVCDRQSERTIVPIGRPLADTQAYLLDRHLEPVPAGVMGEIWIGGAGLARGYAEHPERTAESFRPNPFAQNPGERMFRAQDLG